MTRYRQRKVDEFQEVTQPLQDATHLVTHLGGAVVGLGVGMGVMGMGAGMASGLMK